MERAFDMPAALLAAFLAEFCLRPEEDLALAIACQCVCAAVCVCVRSFN